MKDIAFNNGDLEIHNKDLHFAEEAEALRQQLYVFLNIRACHRNGEGTIIIPGELEYDQEQGIDFSLVLDGTTSKEVIKNHYREKLLQYYGEYINEISRIDVVKDYSDRKLYITIQYTSTFSVYKETIIINNELEVI